MKRNALVFIGCLMALSFAMASCATGKTTTTSSTTPPPTSTTAVAPTTMSAQGKWWDQLGVPQYGGMITIGAGSVPTSFDPSNFTQSGTTGFFDMLFMWDWTVDPSVYPFKTNMIPQEYERGLLVDTWEWQDTQTLILHLRHDVYYQNKPPANGRKFTAHDVEFHYDRMLGTGNGFTQMNPIVGGLLSAVQKVTAMDDYTAQVKFKKPSALNNWNAIANPGPQNSIENPETVQQYGPTVNNWKYAVGTGPFILKDWVEGSSQTLVRNPNYWRYDERYPKNQLPYLSTFRVISIADSSLMKSALRTGRIDYSGGAASETLAELLKTNPGLQSTKMPVNAYALELRVDKAPFTDIKVRQALDLAIDRATMAKSLYHGDVDGNPAGFLSPYTKGYAYDYVDWPQELKDQYSYNPARAKELLAEAGLPGGFKTNAVCANLTTDLDLLQTIQNYFKAINIEMEIRPLESVAFASFVQNAKQDQMIFRAWWAMFSPVDVPIKNFWSKSPGTTTHIVVDPNYDAIVDKFLAVNTGDEAKPLSIEAQKYELEQHWVTPLFPLVNYNLWQPYVKGYSGQLIFIYQQYWIWSRVWADMDLKKSMGY